MIDNYQIRFYKNSLRLNPKKLNVTDARNLFNMLKRELRAMELIYKNYLNEEEVLIQRGKKEFLLSKKEFPCIFDAIFHILRVDELEEVKILVDGREVSIYETKGLPIDHVSFVVIK